MQVVEIEILGRRYAIRSERAPEHLEAVARLVDGRLRDLCGGSPLQRDHAILAALNLASDLVLLQEERGALLQEIEVALTRAIDQIDLLTQAGAP